MSGLRQSLFEALPDAMHLAEVDGVAVVMVPRQDGLLHIRHLHVASYPEEIVGVPDLDERPRRGFWSDAVVAAARVEVPRFGAEVVVGSDTGCELSQSAALVAATLLVMAEAPLPAELSRAAFDFLGVEPVSLRGRQRESLA